MTTALGLVLSVTFGSNVRIGTGHAADGLDETIDRAAPLSSAAVKGVLRDEARWLLPSPNGDHPFIEAVFGSTRGANCPWNFDVAAVGRVEYSNRASLRLDARGAVVPGALLIKEEASIREAIVTITRRSPLTGNGLPEGFEMPPEECHLALLHLAGRAADKLGQRRTRGMGWVALSSERSVEDDLSIIWQIREGTRS